MGRQASRVPCRTCQRAHRGLLRRSGDVVCVPKDASYAKVRICEYLVVGNFAKLCLLPPCPRRRAKRERQAPIIASPMLLSRSLQRCPAMSWREVPAGTCIVVGPLPESRWSFVPGDGRGPMRRDVAWHPVIRLALRPARSARRPLLVGEMNLLGGQDAFALFRCRSRSRWLDVWA